MTNTYNAAIVEVTRGAQVESIHALDIVIADASGSIVKSWGDPTRIIFPRSAVKSLQAIPLVESGAADAYGLEDKHLALACSSHNGEAVHTEAAREILERAGISETCLECGAQNPEFSEDFAELVRNDILPSSIHNNCSGKHSGFLTFAKFTGIQLEGYISREHEVQREIASIMESLTGVAHDEDNCGIDGCSIPTYAVPLDRIAIAYARFGVGENPNDHRSKAMLRLRDACLSHPYMVAGRERVCTRLMQFFGKQAFLKVGAEGVYTASLPELGFGIALKARDGARRAAEVAVASLISRMLNLEEAQLKAAHNLTTPEVTNWRGIRTGEIRFRS